MSSGTIVKRSNRYSVVIDLGRDPTSGKRVRKWHSGFKTKREAEAARIEILGRVARGTFVDPSKQQVGAFLLDEWLPAKRSSIEASTADGYRATIERWIVPHLGAHAVQRLAASHLNAFYAMLLERGGKGGRPLSPRSVRLTHSILRKALSDAVRWNMLPRNPADAADPPKQTASGAAQNVWTARQARAFIESVADDRLRVLWALAIATGMRRGELAGLRWCDVDLERAVLAVRQTRTSVRYEVVTKAPKTASGSRVMSLDKGVVADLRQHKDRQAVERAGMGSAYEVNDLVFRREDGKGVHPELLSEWFRRRVADAGLPAMRFHDLRHLHATLGLAAGIHPLVMSQRLGHANVSITLDTYSHVIPQMDREAADVIGNMLRLPEPAHAAELQDSSRGAGL